MRITLLFAALLAVAAPVLGQPPPTAREGQAFQWDYPDAFVVAGDVSRFEQQLDAGVWTDVFMMVGDAAETFSTPIPALTPGLHTQLVRACNTALCGGASSPLDFEFVADPIPDPVPGSSRIVDTPVP